MSMAVFLNLSHEQEQSEQQEPRRRNSNLKEVRQTLVVAGRSVWPVSSFRRV